MHKTLLTLAFCTALNADVIVENGTFVLSDLSRMIYVGSSAQDLILNINPPSGASLISNSTPLLLEFFAPDLFEGMRVGTDPGPDGTAARFDLFGPEAEPDFFIHPFPCSIATCIHNDEEIGLVIWSDGTVDHIRFQSNPEPTTFILLATAIIFIVQCKNRRINEARRT